MLSTATSAGNSHLWPYVGTIIIRLWQGLAVNESDDCEPSGPFSSARERMSGEPSNGDDAGLSESERYLGRLCNKTFLGLWSYLNLFRASGKELADLVVVFGDHIVIFSDKCCEFPDGDFELAWSRWYRRAVLDSAKQLHRAEGWVRNHSERIFLDAKCEKVFPFEINENARIHLVCVAIGASKACRTALGGSGSLMVSSGKAKPMTFGDIDASKSFVHVFDDVSLDLVLRELDTVSDFVDYLDKKERFMRSGRQVMAAGEEELLAHYVTHIGGDGRHDFVFDEDWTVVMQGEGHWEDYEKSPERARKRSSDEVSYLWDRMIEKVTWHATRGALSIGAELPLSSHEDALRRMASEPRLARRGLSKSVVEVGTRASAETLFTRFVENPGNDHSYLLLRLKQSGDDFDAYRQNRANCLEVQCEIAKLRHPSMTRLIGIAFAPFGGDDNSIDLLDRDFSDWTDERARLVQEFVAEIGPTKLTPVSGEESEYPAQNSSKVAAEDRGEKTESRAARRRNARATRKRTKKKH